MNTNAAGWGSANFVGIIIIIYLGVLYNDYLDRQQSVIYAGNQSEAVYVDASGAHALGGLTFGTSGSRLKDYHERSITTTVTGPWATNYTDVVIKCTRIGRIVTISFDDLLPHRTTNANADITNVTPLPAVCRPASTVHTHASFRTYTAPTTYTITSNLATINTDGTFAVPISHVSTNRTLGAQSWTFTV